MSTIFYMILFLNNFNQNKSNMTSALSFYPKKSKALATFYTAHTTWHFYIFVASQNTKSTSINILKLQQ